MAYQYLPTAADLTDGTTIDHQVLGDWFEMINNNFDAVPAETGGGTVDVAAAMHAATVKNPLLAADELVFLDSTATFGLKKLTFANMKYQFGPVINVKDPTYGAKGDGVTDDYAAITAARDAAWNQLGAIVFFPPGTYMTSQPVGPRGMLTRSGTAQSGTSTTITLATGDETNSAQYTQAFIKITGGTGSGQLRVIKGYNGSTKVATLQTAWTTTPDNTSVYTVQYWPSNARTVNFKGSSTASTIVKAMSGFTDPTFDGKKIVLRDDGTINARYGFIDDMTFDGGGVADHSGYIGGEVEREFNRLLFQNSTNSALVIDASQNLKFNRVRCMGGAYALKLINGAASIQFAAGEFTNCTTEALDLGADNTFRCWNWYTNVLYPLMNTFTTCLFEIPQAGHSEMVPLRIVAGVSNKFDHCTFAATYSSGTASEGCVVVGDGLGTYPVHDNEFVSCQFYRGNDNASHDYVVVKANTQNTILENCKWTGGYSGGSVAVRASAPVLIDKPSFLDAPKTVVNAAGTAELNIHIRPMVNAWTTSTRPYYGGVGVIPPGYNVSTGLLEFYDGSAWQSITGGGGGGGGATPVVGAVPTGTKNGTNTVFTLGSAYDAGTTAVYINGLRETNYTESGSGQITFGTAPLSGDVIIVDYFTT